MAKEEEQGAMVDECPMGGNHDRTVRIVLTGKNGEDVVIRVCRKCRR